MLENKYSVDTYFFIDEEMEGDNKMLKGNKINLRPMESDDLELFYQWRNNQEFMGKYVYAELNNKEGFIEKMKQNLQTSNSKMLIIEDKQGKSIGVMNYINTPFSTVSVDFGILLANTSYRGQGIGQEAITLLVNFLFNSKNIARIQFITRTDNEAMKSLGEKTGFRLEGVMRKYMFDHGECRDYCLYSIIRDDWKKL